MTNITFVVRVSHGSAAPVYVQRVYPAPVHMTTDRKVPLIMGRFTAEDAVISIENSRCIPELGN
jgi:hypothetical protein